MATKADIKKMPSIVSKNTRYFYEVDKQGNKIIRHILIGSPENILQIPSDGHITIDTLPADSVGSEQIENESVEMEDLSPRVKEQMADRVSQQDLDNFQV